MKKVKDILRTKADELWSIGPRETVYEAIHLLAEKEIGALIVLDGDQLVGIISERDYTRQIILQGRSSDQTKVSDIMSGEVVTASPEEDIQECMRLMTDRRIRHLPICNGEVVIGIISIGDLVRAIIAEQQSTIVDLEKYIQG